jgi:hypothetical protein
MSYGSSHKRSKVCTRSKVIKGLDGTAEEIGEQERYSTIGEFSLFHNSSYIHVLYVVMSRNLREKTLRDKSKYL